MASVERLDARSLARLWELSPDLCAVADLEGRFLYVNDRWREVTGHTTDELMSRPYVEFVHPDDRDATASLASRMATTGEVVTGFENRYHCHDGSWVWLSWCATAELDEHRIYAVASDVTDRRHAISLLDLVGCLADAANQSETLEAALERAVACVCLTTGWPVGHAWVRADGDDDGFVSTGIWHANDAETLECLRAATSGLAMREGDGLPGRVVRLGEPVWVTDVHDAPWLARSGPALKNLASAFAVPVTSEGEIVAVLEFFMAAPLQPDEELLEVVTRVGRQVGRVHERSRQFSAEKEALNVETRFLSMLTHELRSPLVSIKGFLDLVLDRWGQLSEAQKIDFLERAGSSTDRLSRMVDEFLQLARHHAEGFRPRLQAVDLGDLADDVLVEMSDGAEEVVLSRDGEVTAWADADFVRQILINLVTNAQRYGRPPIEVTVWRAQDPDVVGISVRDHGPGVPEHFVPHMFQRFARADRQSGGTGLGLSIARDLAEAMDADLDFEPAEGGGSRFILRVPPAGSWGHQVPSP